jgi:chitinase
MDAVTFITKLQKFIKDSYQNIGDAMISGTVDSMEKYKYMQGQANAYQTIIQEISNLLNKKEQNDEKGNVIDLGNGKGSSKDKTRS